MRRMLAGVAIVATLAGCGTAQATESQGPENVAPYCMVDREVPQYLTVAGPAGGEVSVDGVWRTDLEKVTPDDYGSEVAPDAAPFDGIAYNVPGPGEVDVDGHVCETT